MAEKSETRRILKEVYGVEKESSSEKKEKDMPKSEKSETRRILEEVYSDTSKTAKAKTLPPVVSSELPDMLPKAELSLSGSNAPDGDVNISPFDREAGGPAFMPGLRRNVRAIPITELGESLAQGNRNMGYGFQSAAGETANEYTGSSRDYKNAIELYDYLQKGGRLKDLKNKSGEEIYDYLRGVPAKNDKPGFFDILAEMGEATQEGLIGEFENEASPKKKEKEKEYNLLVQALKSDNPRAFLEQGAETPTWGDRQIEESAIGIAKSRPTKGVGAWLGNVAPMAGTGLITIATATNPYTRPLTKPLAHATMGAFALSSAGESMTAARLYAAENNIDISDDTVHAVGALTGIAMYTVGKIPLMKGVNLLTGAVGKNTSSKIAGEIISNPAARAEAASFFRRAAKDIPGLKSFTSESAKKIGKDVLHGAGVGEGLAVSNSLIPMLYQNREDYPKLNEIQQFRD